MGADLAVRCFCGKLRGIAHAVSPRAGNHLACYCDDCQSFQHALGQAERVLDANGGTDIYQMSPKNFRITQGRENLACMRLKPGGLTRWYASCCDTPVGNTLGKPGMPFVGVTTVCFDRSGGSAAVDAALGPVRGGVHGRFAYGDRAGLDAHDKAPVSMIFGFLGKMMRWRMQGAHKDSPFFDSETGRLSVAPRVLSAEELQDVERRRDAMANAAD